MKYVNIPNILTFFRLILSPLMLPLLFFYLLPLNVFWINIALAGLFVFFSITGLFDGYVSHKFGQKTMFGRLLDPMADKCLSYSTLIALLAVNKIFFYWVIILVGRTIFMMGLRIIALESGFKVPVSFLGKINSFLQTVYITVVIINPNQGIGLKNIWNKVEMTLLVTVIIFAILSSKKYLDTFMQLYGMRNPLKDAEDVSVSHENQ